MMWYEEEFEGVPYSRTFDCPSCGRKALKNEDIHKNATKVEWVWDGETHFTKHDYINYGYPSFWKDFRKVVTCVCGQRWWTHDTWLGVLYHYRYREQEQKEGNTEFVFRNVDDKLIQKFEGFMKRAEKLNWDKEKKGR